jgi:hypothetical protein
MKRSLSQFGMVDERAHRRRCVVPDCPHAPDDSNTKCEACLSLLCSNRLCLNPCKQGVRGRKLKRCEAHSQKLKPRMLLQATETHSQGASHTRTRVLESQQASSTQQAKVVRQFSQQGIIEQETVTSTTQTLTQTWRQKIVDCKQEWRKSEYERLVSGADCDKMAVAFPAIRIAYSEPENKFEDVEDCTGSLDIAAVRAVDKLRALHTKALHSIQIPNTLPDHQKHLLEIAKTSGSLPGTLTPQDLLLLLQSAKRAMFQACRHKETHPLYSLYSMASHSLSSLLSSLEDFFPRFDQSSPVNRVFSEEYHYYQHINDLIGPNPEEKEPPPNPHLHRGYLFPKPPEPPVEPPLKKPKKEKNGLPLPNNEPDLLCGFTRLHFIELGTMLGLNGMEVWRVLSVVQNLQRSDEDLFSLVLSGQLMVRCATQTLNKADLAQLTLRDTLPDGKHLDMSYIASPCVWMHRSMTDHGNPCARVRLKINAKMELPPSASAVLKLEADLKSEEPVESRPDDSKPVDSEKKPKPVEIDCNVFLPHQCMEMLIKTKEKDPSDPVLGPHYLQLRQQHMASKVRGSWAQMEKDTSRSVFGVPLHSRLLNHPAFEPLRAYTEQQNAAL